MNVSLVLGSPETEHLRLTVAGRAYPDATDYWDGNWIRTRIRARVGGFTADVAASLRTDEFVRFAEELALLHETLSGTAT